MLWLLLVWLCYRQPDCGKDLAVANVEIVLAHLLMGTLSGLLFQTIVLHILYRLRDKRIFLSLFFVSYLSLNFWVNLTDLLYSGVIHDYYHDEFFLTSVSYKLHQVTLCAVLAYVVSEMMAPSDSVTKHAQILSHTFSATVLVAFSLALCFMYELTWYASERRIKVFKTEISKVLMTIVYFNLFALIFISWMWQLSKQIKQMQRSKEHSAVQQRNRHEEQVKRLQRYGRQNEAPEFKVKAWLSETERAVMEFE